MINRTSATLENLDGLDEEGVDTLLKAFYKTVGRYHEHPWLGTRNGIDYKWITF